MIDYLMALTWGVPASAACLLIWRRQDVVTKLKKWETSEWWLAVTETVSTVAAGFFLARFKVWDTSSWNGPDHLRLTLYALSGFLSTAFLAFFAKWTRDKVKERDKDKVKTLEEQIATKEATLRTVTDSLDSRKRLSSQISGLIERKISHTRQTLKRPVKHADLLMPTERETHVHTILQAIHEFFYFDLRQRNPTAKVRLGLYLPDPTASKLKLFYSWDGTKQSCFQHAHPQYMRLNSPQGILAEIVKTYHSGGDRHLSLIPDCEKAEQAGTFKFFHHRQHEYLKSMLSFKYLFELDGTEAALILSLDCNESGFFGTGRQAEITEFLVDMLLRFEYEMLGIELVGKLTSVQP